MSVCKKQRTKYSFKSVKVECYSLSLKSGCPFVFQAGNYVHNDIVSIVIQLIASASQLHSYSVRQLYFLMKEDNSQQPLIQVAAWCVGEYGEQVLLPSGEEDDLGQVREIL